MAPEPPEDMPLALARAIVAARKAQPDREPFMLYLASGKVDNRTTLVAVLKLALDQNPRLEKARPLLLGSLAVDCSQRSARSSQS